jgi:oxepin-CoA hydrolase/3-oxo-5,6-dehydrosuberyl-CoA semialdehyde dehydrogenase
MKKLGNYVMGRWIEGDGDLQILADAVTGAPVYQAGTRGLDFHECYYARTVGICFA